MSTAAPITPAPARKATASLLASSMWAAAQVCAPGHRLIQ